MENLPKSVKLFDGLKFQHAEFVQDCVGLRPGREEIRVEAEAVEFERNGKIREQKVEVFS